MIDKYDVLSYNERKIRNGGRNMPQTIIDLWRGDIGPIDRCGIGDREANMLSLQMERSETKTEALLKTSL